MRACITASTWGNGRLRKGSRVPFGEEYIIQYIPSLSLSTSPTIQIHACGVSGSRSSLGVCSDGIIIVVVVVIGGGWSNRMIVN